MFLLKLLFFIGLLLLIAIIAYTIYHKLTNPSKSVMECLPFYDELFKDKEEVSNFSDQIPDEIQAGNSSSVEDQSSDTLTEEVKSETKAEEAAVKEDAAALKSEDKAVKSEKAPEVTDDAPAKAEAKKPAAKKATTAKKTSAKKPEEKKAPAKKAAAKPKAKAAPKKAAPKAKAAAKGDNIKKVNGIGPVFEKKLNSIGINTFEQIANWSDEDVARIDEELDLKGRPEREEWVQKAKTILASQK